MALSPTASRTMNNGSGQSLDLLVPRRRGLWDGIKGIPGSMQLVDIPRLQHTWAYGYIIDGLKYIAAGAVVDAIRRSFVWLYQRLKLRYSTGAEFVVGDPSYEWIVLFLTENGVWENARDFRVTSKSSKLVYGVSVSADPDIVGSADYVPTYESPQLFRWRGYWVEVQRYRAQIQGVGGQPQQAAAIFLTVFTRNLSVLSELVEEAHRGYQHKIKPYVTVFLADSPSFGGSFLWNVKRKPHRPIESIILPDGILDDLISDAKRFFASEAWYHRAGIPHRRGYLLFGPPGTGKSSTIHAVAGELNLEIHSFSLSSAFVDDAFLQRATATIPKRSIVLVEDIDCITHSRDEDDEDDEDGGGRARGGGDRRRHGVTLSGLLNMIDGIGSEEGKLFFATTNYVDRLDAALMRPGRIDRRIRYALATGAQAKGLFERLFQDAEVDGAAVIVESSVKSGVDGEMEKEVPATPSKLVESEDVGGQSGTVSEGDGSAPNGTSEGFVEPQMSPLDDQPRLSPPLNFTRPESVQSPTGTVGAVPLAPRKLSDSELSILAQQFAAALRDYEFSPAELQGYLLLNREQPIEAATEMSAWVQRQRDDRAEKAELRAERRERRAKMYMEAARFQQQQQQYGPYPGFPVLPGPMPMPPPGSFGVSPPLAPPPIVSPSPVPLPPSPPADGGDVDVAAAPLVALAAVPAAAPASPPPMVASPLTPIVTPDVAVDADPPVAAKLNGINGIS